MFHLRISDNIRTVKIFFKKDKKNVCENAVIQRYQDEKNMQFC